MDTAQSQSLAFASALRAEALWTGLAILLVCIPLVLVLLYWWLLPLRQLLSAMQQAIGGDFDVHVAINRDDVIGRLGRSFNQLVLRVRRQQRALSQANLELEQHVRQRTAQLEAANKRLSNEIAEKEEFLRAISHDLNAPLRNIAGMAELILKKTPNLQPEIARRLERIIKNVDVESGLIAELLELSQIKTRRLRAERVEIRQLVEEVAGTFEADLKQQEIQLFINGAMPALRCERARLRQVFQNLIDNAIKYMGPNADPREIRVGCQLRAEEAEFYVCDSGMGMSLADRASLFRVFHRGANARAAGIPGKGVGLASVKSIVETYSGSIWVQSTPGAGTTVRFTINGQYVLPPVGAKAA